MAKVKKIKENGVTIYPATIMQAVKDPNTGQGLDEKLSELGSKVVILANSEKYKVNEIDTKMVAEFSGVVFMANNARYTKPFSGEVEVQKNEMLILSLAQDSYTSLAENLLYNDTTVYLIKDIWANLNKYNFEDVILINNSPRKYIKDYTLSKDIQDINKDIQEFEPIKETIYKSKEISLLPLNTSEKFTDEYYGDDFTNIPIAKGIFENNSIYFVDYIVYKPTSSSGGYLYLYGMSVDAEGNLSTIGLQESIQLKNEWLSSDYGDGVYKIPFNKQINYIPSVRRFCFAKNNGVGYIAAGQNVNNPSQPNREILFGIEGREVLSRIEETNKLVEKEISRVDEELSDLKKKVNLKGKKIAFLGDSMTEYGHYVKSFTELTGCTAVNYGMSGTRMVKNNNNDSNTFEQRYLNIDNDVDAIFILGGINDFRVGSVAFGSISDFISPSAYTFYGGLHRLLNGVLTKFFPKPVVVMTPMHTYEKNLETGVTDSRSEFIIDDNGKLTVRVNSSSNKTLREYVDAIKEVSQFYSVPVIDLYSESKLSPILDVQRGVWFSRTDGLHHNALGGVEVARTMVEKLKSIVI